MNIEAHHKVQAEHVARAAMLDVRQSTLPQVQENVESTKRQYALRDRALALGWTAEQIIVIDCDQGQSGGSATEREGHAEFDGSLILHRLREDEVPAALAFLQEELELVSGRSSRRIDAWPQPRQPRILPPRSRQRGASLLPTRLSKRQIPLEWLQ